MRKVITDSWVMGYSRNLKRSVAFYAKFGLRPSIQRPYYVEMKVPGGTVLGLHIKGNGRGGRKRASRRNNPGGWEMMLRVRDIKKTVSDLKRRHVPCARVKTAPGGALFSSASDPDGNRLLLLQMPK